jgi:hypothetical protein
LTIETLLTAVVIIIRMQKSKLEKTLEAIEESYSVKLIAQEEKTRFPNGPHMVNLHTAPLVETFFPRELDYPLEVLIGLLVEKRAGVPASINYAELRNGMLQFPYMVYTGKPRLGLRQIIDIRVYPNDSIARRVLAGDISREAIPVEKCPYLIM